MEAPLAFVSVLKIVFSLEKKKNLRTAFIEPRFNDLWNKKRSFSVKRVVVFAGSPGRIDGATVFSQCTTRKGTPKTFLSVTVRRMSTLKATTSKPWVVLNAFCFTNSVRY